MIPATKEHEMTANDLATSTGTVGLDRVAAHLTDALGSHFHVENLGGGVMALVDYSGLTVTLNDGRPVLDDTEAPASVLVCLDGAGIATGTASTPAEVVGIVTAAYAATGS